MTKSKAGRKAVDGATNLTVRINAVLTEEHKRKLDMLAVRGISPWVRQQIDQAWDKFTKEKK